MKKIMIPINYKPYEIPDYEEYNVPNKVVEYIEHLEKQEKQTIKDLEEELKNLRDDYSLVVVECKKYKERNNDALQYVKYHREVIEEGTIYETSKFDKYTNPKVLLNKLEGVKDGI